MLAPQPMAATKSTKARTISTRPRKPVSAPESSPETGPSFAEIGREAAREAQRKALLRAWKANDWNLSRTAETLQMGSSSAVIRALKLLAPEEYDAAREDGRIRAGRRWEE